jgi:diguanylate cyclase (GGDEF)-like protein
MLTESQKLERQLRSELGRHLPRLAFDRELLERYRDALRRDRKFARMFYYLTVAVIFGFAPFYSDARLHIPSTLDLLFHSLELGLILPLSVLGAVVDFTRLPKAMTGAVHAGATFCLWAVLLLMQRAAHAENFYFPPQILGVAILCGAVLCGFRLQYILWGIGLFTGLNIASEWFNRSSAANVLLTDSLLTVLLGLAAAGSTYFMEVLQRRLWLAGELAEVAARTDPLTGLATRAEFNLRFAQVLAQARREQRPLAVMLIDVDNFKSINDGYGHLYGDDVLRQVGTAILQLSRRPLDIQARYGGEEMVIVWYDCLEDVAQRLAQEILQSVRTAALPRPPVGVAPRLTLSAGVVVLIPDAGTHPVELLRAADDLMYQAKRAGKDRVLLRSGMTPAAACAGALRA